MNDQLDPQAMALTKAIRQVESGGNFKARSKDGSFGAYQFLKPTWDNTARKYGVNAEWEKATPQQQNEVAYKQIKEWKDKGHNVGEIASMWNAGAGRPQAYLQGVQGTNSSGVNYNVANYAKKVATLYQEYKGQSQPQVQQEPIEPVEPIEPTIQEQKQVIQTQGQPVSVRKDRTQPTLVGGIIRDIVKQPIKAALTIARPFVDPIGKKSGLSVNTKYLGNVGDYGTEIEKSTNNLANKYKAGEISLGRAALGGAGAGALQAMDFAAVAPVGKVASQAIRGTVKQSLVPTLKAAAKESLIREGAINAGYDVSSQLASGEKYNPLQTVAAGTVGTVADLGLSYGLPKAISGTKSFAKNNLTKAGRDAKLTRKVEEELFNIENNYAKLRKNQKYSKDANTATRKRIVTTGVLDDAVDTNGTINADNAIKKYRDASGLSGKEGVVRQNLERLGEKLNIKDAEKQLTDTVYTSGLEGAELRTALNNVKKEVSGYRLRADADGNLPLTFFHDAKIGTTNSIDFNTPADIKAYKKTLASGLKDIVENNSQFNVKEVNKELSPLFKDIEYLESLNGRKVKGGKLGKYASQVTGNIVGGVAGGAIGGFPGSAIGTVVGGEVGSALRGSSLSKVLRGPGAKELPVSKVLQKAAATAKNQRLGLPEPKPGLPKSQNFVPIELPGVKEPVYRSPRIAGNTTQYTNIPNTKPKNIDIPTELPKPKVKSSDLSTGEDLVTVYHASPKLPKNGNWRTGTYFAETPEKASYYASSHHRGKIDVQEVKIPRSKLSQQKTNGNYTLNEEFPVKESVLPKVNKVIPELEKEAKKYKSAEEFVKAQGTPVYHGTKSNIDIKDLSAQTESRGQYLGNGIYFTKYKEGADFYGGKTLSAIVNEKDFLNISNLKGIERTNKIGSFGTYKQYLKNSNLDDTLANFKKWQKNQQEVADKILNMGYKGVTDGQQHVIFDKSAIKTKSQLEEIWKKANKSPLPKPKTKSSDLSTGVKKAYNNAIDTLKTLKDKNVRERGSISLESILPERKPKGNQGVSLAKNTTEDLIQQAKKYKSAEEFVKAQGDTVYHGTNRIFDKFDISKVNKDRVKEFGGAEAIYFSPSKEVAGKYTKSAQSSLFPKEKTIEVLKNKDKTLGDIVEIMVNDGEDAVPQELWKKAIKLEKENKIDYNIAYDIAQVIENSRSALPIQGIPGFGGFNPAVNRAATLPYSLKKKLGIDIETIKQPREIETFISPDAKIKDLGYFSDKEKNIDGDYITITSKSQLNKAVEQAKKQGFDGIKFQTEQSVDNTPEVAIWNLKKINTRKELEQIWKEANKKILPKNTKLIRNKDGSVEYGSQKMSGDFKGMSDKEIIKMFEDTPF